MSEKVIDLLGELIAVPSVSSDFKQTKAVLDLIEKKAHPSFHINRVEKEGVGSMLVSTHPGMEHDVVIVTHADVVPAPDALFTMKQEGDKLFGRGVFDMKGPLAGVLAAMNALAEEGRLNKKVALLVVTDEETGGKYGASYWVNELGLKGKVVLDPDNGAGLGVITEKTKQVMFLKLTSHGTAGHGAYPWTGEDAIENLIGVWMKFREAFPYYHMKNEPADKWVSTMHIGSITGGSATNVIAEKAEVLVDFRFTKDEDKEKVFSILKSLPPSFSFEIPMTAFGMNVKLDHPEFERYENILKKHGVSKIELRRTGGTTDARFFVPQGSLIIPHQPLGGDLHSENEWASASELVTYTDAIKEFLA